MLIHICTLQLATGDECSPPYPHDALRGKSYLNKVTAGAHARPHQSDIPSFQNSSFVAVFLEPYVMHRGLVCVIEYSFH